jgi:hypothetical protein
MSSRLPGRVEPSVLIALAASAIVVLVAKLLVPESSEDSSPRLTAAPTRASAPAPGVVAAADPTGVQGVAKKERVTDPVEITPAAFDSNWIRTAIASGDVKELEAAFEQLRQCASIPERKQMYYAIDRLSDAAASLASLEKRIKEDERLCAGVEHDLISRQAVYLRKALASQFSPKLVSLYYMAGPLGDWSQSQTRADDPLVLSWFDDTKKLLSVAASRGDLDSMRTLFEIYHSGPASQRDPALALVYLMAEAELRFRDGTAVRGGPTSRLIEQESATRSPEELRIAQVKAKALLQSCCGIQ